MSPTIIISHISTIEFEERVRHVLTTHLSELQSRTDRIFGWLFASQWLFGIACALTMSPYTWNGTARSLHIHVSAAVLLGAAIISLPLLLILRRSGHTLTRHVVTAAQFLYSALLIDLMGGRIEAHFHVFGSLAILAFYRDVKVFIPAVALVFADHLLRGFYWPQSVFGVLTVTPWRAIEHAGWVLFETAFLIWGVRQSLTDLLGLSRLQVSLTDERDLLENKVENRVSELKQQRHLMQNVVDNIPGAVYWKDTQLRYMGCNRAFAQAAGFECAEELIGKGEEELLWTLEDRTKYRQCDQEVLESRRPQLNTEECRHIPAEGLKTLLTSRVPLVDGAGHAIGMIGLFQDITERKLLEAQLSQAQKLESIGQLAAGVAHEINTPMQCVSSNVEFLKNCYQQVFHVVDSYRAQLDGPKMDWQERKEQIDRLLHACRYDVLRIEAPAAIEEASDAVERVIDIVRAMKAMSHPGTKDKVLTNINELIRSAAAISKNRWKYVAHLDLRLDETLPDLYALPAELNQVFLNLIVNAADAIAGKLGDSPHELGVITIRTYLQKNGVRIDVQDTGCGVPEEIRHRVFDPFFTTKQVGKGTGQGLAITYDLIVNKHQGWIKLDPRPGRGAVFSVWIPNGANASLLDATRTIELEVVP